VTAHAVQVDRERVTCAHLLEANLAEAGGERFVLEHALEDEALGGECDDRPVGVRQLEQRPGVGREQHDVEVVEQHRDRCGALELAKGGASGGDEIADLVQLRAQQRGERLAVELADADDLRVRLRERRVVDDDAVVQRDRTVRDDGLVVVDVALRAVRGEPRVARDRERWAGAFACFEFVERTIEHLAELGIREEVGDRAALLQDVDAIAVMHREPGRFTTASLGVLQ
jgi:hypothetical protein